MTEADLARPVVAVSDFETGRMEYELYSYGEETVVIPVSGRSQSPVRHLAAGSVEEYFRKFADSAKVEMVSDHKAVVSIPEENIPKVIGKEGKKIASIEERLGISIDVQPLSRKAAARAGKGRSVDYHAKILRKNILFEIDGRPLRQERERQRRRRFRHDSARRQERSHQNQQKEQDGQAHNRSRQFGGKSDADLISAGSSLEKNL